MFSSPLFILFTTVALDLIGFGMVVPLMPLYARTFGVGPQAIAALMACYSLMQFFFAPVWGALSDRIGRRPVLLATMAGNVLALAAFAGAQSFSQLFLSRVLSGVCAANLSVASAYIADITPAHQRARGMGIIGAAFGLGFVLGPFFAGELSVWGPRAPSSVAASLAAANGIMAFLRLPESHHHAATGQVWPRQSLSPWAILRRRFVGAGQNRAVSQLLLLIFCHVFGFAMMEMALTLVVAGRLGFGSLQAGRLLAYVGVVLVLVQGALVGRLSKRFGDAPLFVAGLVLLGLGLWATAAAAPLGVAALIAALGSLAAGQGLVSPTGSALLSRCANEDMQGEVLGLGQSCAAMARVCGPLAAGIIFQTWGDLEPMLVGGGIVLAAALLASFWLSITPRTFMGSRKI